MKKSDQKYILFIVIFLLQILLYACGSNEEINDYQNNLYEEALNKLQDLSFCSTTKDCAPTTAKLVCSLQVVNKQNVEKANKIIEEYNEKIFKRAVY